MAFISIMLTTLVIIFWTLVILVAYLIIIRLVRWFTPFPIPAFVVRFIDNPLRRRIQPPAQVVDWVGIRGDMMVLEIGSGPGTFTIEAASRIGGEGKLFAVDIQPSVIKALDDRLQRDRVTNVETEVASVYDLPFMDNSFDRVFMVTVLGEIPDKEKALVEIRRVLKEDGLLAVGEFLPDPDYPRRKTVIRRCWHAGFELVTAYGGIMHYLLLFKRTAGGKLLGQ